MVTAARHVMLDAESLTSRAKTVGLHEMICFVV